MGWDGLEQVSDWDIPEGCSTPVLSWFRTRAVTYAIRDGCGTQHVVNAQDEPGPQTPDPLISGAAGLASRVVTLVGLGQPQV